MNKNLNKGASKRKGAAEDLSVPAEKLTYIQDSEGTPRKKGAAQSVWSSLDAAAERDKAANAWNKKVHGGKKGSTNVRGKEIAGFNLMPPPGGTKGISSSGKPLQKGKTTSSPGTNQDLASVIYDVDQDGDNFLQDYNQDGTMVGRGIQKVAKWLGASQKMGFTQNFGAARQNSYAKGAAKVSSIMNYGGAAKADYDKDMAEERIQIKDDKDKIWQDDKDKKDS
jgi:hypothetical protein